MFLVSFAYGKYITFRNGIIILNLIFVGVAHCDEIGLLWGGRVVENAILFTAKDKELSKDLVKLWVDFANK